MGIANIVTLQGNLTFRDSGFERGMRKAAQNATKLSTSSRKTASSVDRVGKSARKSGTFVSRYATQTRGAVRGSNALAAAARRAAGALAVLFGARQLARFARGTVDAFAEQQQAVEGLRAALVATGKSASEVGLVTAEAARLQRETTAADEALIRASSSLALLAPALNTQELVRAQSAIKGIADTFLKGDVENAALLIGKSIGSTTNALTRYGVQVDTSATQTEKLNSIVAQSAGFFAVSQAKADTLAGRVVQLNNAWGDLKETIGELLVDGLDLQRLAEGTTGQIQRFTEALSVDAGIAFGALGGLMGAKLGEGILRGLSATATSLAEGLETDSFTDHFVSGPLRAFAAAFDFGATKAAEAVAFYTAEIDQLSVASDSGRGRLEALRTETTRLASAIATGGIAGLIGSFRITPILDPVDPVSIETVRSALASADLSVPVLFKSDPLLRGSLESLAAEFAGTVPLSPFDLQSVELTPEQLERVKLDLTAATQKIADEKAIKAAGFGIGEDLVFGIIQGSISLGDILKRAMAALAQHFILKPLAVALKIFSPSKLTADMGRNLGLGFVVGMDRMQPLVRAASVALAGAALVSLPSQALAISSNLETTSNVIASIEQPAPQIIVDMTGVSLFQDPATEARKTGSQVFIREGTRAARDGGFR